MLLKTHLELHHEHLLWKSDLNMWLTDLEIWENKVRWKAKNNSI